MKVKQYGYVRVSSRDQNVSRQLIALEKIPVSPNNIFIDRQSGKDFNRPSYQKLLKTLRPGDILYIKSIDRLGRNYDEIMEQWRILTKQKDIEIVVIDFPLLDTRNHMNGLTGKFIADLVLQILSYVAQMERENIRQRQAEGIAAAKARGIAFGRPTKPLPSEFIEVLTMWEHNKISLREAARRLGTNHTTMAKWIREYRGGKIR